MSRRPTTTGMKPPSMPRSASMAMPPPAKASIRPSSVLSGSSTSAAKQDESRPSSPKKGKKVAPNGAAGAKTDNGEINIQVVVRCRGRSPQELASASPLITTTSGPISKSITVETTPYASSVSAFTTASSYGSGPTTKTYPFDKVFGPEADQTMVFNEVAEEMLHEVLAGYNCTIFAYGQTGTGKTYTMQGDLELSNLSAPKMEAGIVPRVLHRLFSLLQAGENTEFSVKCSYVELYNEELRDLLATDYNPATAADKQPMSNNGNATGGLKLYDDGKKGVMIQGLEETAVRNLKEALGMLNKGCQRRQTAETKMNTESSRSHTIFSITVHVKETSVSGGEDLLKVGKFNLVDLAGSEAIGRSGATDKRAREAGMINQSLLTLGRVISALVEKGSHIPYRESKLTRLLQDSLGGKTKTCIVATVSPTRSNMEETLSTLDYAIRAKSIRNRPEINQHLTKTGLLREYMGDIERLKVELLAAREKNGIFIPEEQWKEMHEQQAKMKSDFDEAKMKANQIAVELNTMKKEFNEVSEQFLATTEELAEAREAERQLGILIEETKVELEILRVRLEEETVISTAYVQGEERVGAVADGLKQVANESVADVGGLFEKLARKAKILGANTDAATVFGNDINSISTDLRKGLKQLHHVHGEFGKSLRSDLSKFNKSGHEASQKDITTIDQALSAFQSSSQALAESLQQGQIDSAAGSDQLLLAKSSVQQSVRTWAAAVSDRSAKMVDDVLEHQQTHLQVVGSVLSSTADLVEAVITTTSSHLAAEAQAAEQSQRQAQTAANNEISRLRSQNALLTRMLGEEKAKTARLRIELVSNLTSMIEQFTDAQDQSWSEAVGQVQSANNTGVEQMELFSRQTESHWSAMQERSSMLGEELDMASNTVGQQRRAGQEAFQSVSTGVRDRLELFGRDTQAEAMDHLGVIDGQCEVIGNLSTSLSTRTTDLVQNQQDMLGQMGEAVAASYKTSRERAIQSALAIKTVSQDILQSNASSTSTFDAIYAESSKNTKSILAATSTFLTSGLLEDVPTGVTPKKKVWNVTQSWERTEPRDVLLEAFRRRKDGQAEDVVHESTNPISAAMSTESVPALAGASPAVVEEIPPPSALSVSQIRMKPKVIGGKDYGVKETQKVVLVPLGETGGNIPRRKAVR